MKINSTGRFIALSAGGSNEELAAQGIGLEHVEELMVRLSMRLLREGHRLAFGGTLGNQDQPLTQYLIDTAQGWLDEDSAKQSDVTRPETWPLVNYSAWPFYASISEEQRAELVGICRFVDIDPPRVSKAELDELIETWHEIPQARLHTANSLSAMRDQSAKETDLRIVWGGRIRGAAGWMAGILEEVSCSLAHQKPVLVLGGFGGCARLIAKYLHDESSPWPEELSPVASADLERDAVQRDVYQAERINCFKQTQKLVSNYRSELHSNGEVYGVSTSLLNEALTDESSRRVIQIAAEMVGHW